MEKVWDSLVAPRTKKGRLGGVEKVGTHWSHLGQRGGG